MPPVRYADKTKAGCFALPVQNGADIVPPTSGLL